MTTSEPQDIAALREEVARAIYSFDSWPTESSGMPAAYEVTDVVFALPTVLALLSEVERGRALRAAVEVLAECSEPHGGDHNEATVYGHRASLRICIRLFGTNTWVYDPRWEV